MNDYLALQTIRDLFSLWGQYGCSLFFDSKIGILLLFTHILACISVGFIFRWWKCSSVQSTSNVESQISSKFNHKSVQYLNFSNLGEILAKSIMSSINTMVLISGFVILFSVILSILESSQILCLSSQLLTPMFNIFGISTNYSTGFISGLIELTNGVNLISLIPAKSLSINIILCAFLIGFGGISVLLQVLSITSKSGLSIKPYIYGKLLQATFAALYTFLILRYSIFFNFDL